MKITSDQRWEIPDSPSGGRQRIVRIVFEHDTWWWEELGFEGQVWWGWESQKRPVTFRLRYPDKLCHALATAGLAWLLARWISPSLASAIAFVVLWVGLELRIQSGTLYAGSVKDTLADAIGAVLAYLVLRN